jgi:hypothetical protein
VIAFSLPLVQIGLAISGFIIIFHFLYNVTSGLYSEGGCFKSWLGDQLP